MDDNGTIINDAIAKARSERRRLLVGGGVAGSLMLTLPGRRLMAGTKKKKNHGSIWCSFCNAKKKKSTALSNTPITARSCGDAPSTWAYFSGSTDPNQGPVGWASWNFEASQGFPRPKGLDLYINGVKSNSSTPTFKQCINGQVTYGKGSNKTYLTAAYAQQAACSYLNAYYYACNGISYYRGNCTTAQVCSAFNSQTAPGQNTVATTFSAYNIDTM
jgi:hypothetical protein